MELNISHEDTKVKNPEKKDENQQLRSSNQEISIDVLQNRHLLKEIFLSLDNKQAVDEIYKKYEQMTEETKLKMWNDGHLKKFKEHLIFSSLNSRLMSDLMTKEKKVHGNLHYYNSYLKIYEGLQARNLDSLQLLRHTYIMKNSQSGEGIKASASTADWNSKGEFIEKLSMFVNEETAAKQDKGSESFTYVLPILSSSISVFYSDCMDSQSLLQCLDNLLSFFKVNHYQCQKLSYEVSVSIEQSLLLLVELCTNKIFKSNAFSKDIIGKILFKFVEILQYFKSNQTLIKVLNLLKDNQDLTISLTPFDNLSHGKDIDTICSALFKRENSMVTILTENPSSCSTSELDVNGIISNYETNHCDCVFNKKPEDMIISIVADDKFLYVLINNRTHFFLAKIGLGFNGSIKKQIYCVKILKSNTFQEAKTKMILVHGFLYIVYSLEKTQILFETIEKGNLEIVHDAQIVLGNNEKYKSIQNIFSDGENFYLVLVDAGNKIYIVKTKPKSYTNERLLEKVLNESYEYDEKVGIFPLNEISLSANFLKEMIVTAAGKDDLTAFTFNFNRKEKKASCEYSLMGKSKKNVIVDAHYSKESNYILLLEFLNSTFTYAMYKSFEVSPYEINYMNKKEIKQIMMPQREKEIGIEMNPNLTALLSNKANCMDMTVSSAELHSRLLYSYVKYILDYGNSTNFHVNESKVTSHLLPLSFTYDLSQELFHLIFQNMKKGTTDCELLCWLILMKHYIHNVEQSGIFMKDYLSSQMADNIVLFIFNFLQGFENDNSTTVRKCLFNESTHILKILISQKLLLNFKMITNLFNICATLEMKFKLAEIISSIVISCEDTIGSTNEFPEEIFKVIIELEKDLLFTMDNLDKMQTHHYHDLASKAMSGIKEYFTKTFTRHLLDPQWMQEINNENFLANKIFSFFIKEMTEYCKLLYERLDDIFAGPSERRRNYIAYVESSGLNPQISFFLIQIFISNLKQLNSSGKGNVMTIPPFPRLYLQDILNLFITLQKISSSRHGSSFGMMSVSSDILYQIESEHPFASEDMDQRIQIRLNSQKCDISIESDILSNIDEKSKLALTINNSNITYTNNFPVLEKQYEKVDMLYLSLENANKGQAVSKSKFWNDFGFAMDINVYFPDSHSLISKQRASILSDIRRSIVHSIMYIIKSNFETPPGNENEGKDRIIFKSVFHSKLLQFISVSSSHCDEIANVNNIKEINAVANQIYDKSIKDLLMKTFTKYMYTDEQMQKTSQENNNDDLNILRTYSSELMHSYKKSFSISSQIANITNMNDVVYYKGIKYLQKALSMKNAYLANLGGQQLDSLVVNIFGIILKFQNLADMYCEKYIGEIFNLEGDINLMAIKPEDLNKIESFSLFLKIWSECSKIRIWFLERKMAVAESIEKEKSQPAFETEVENLLNTLNEKAKFFSSIICNPSTAESPHFSQETIDNILTCIKTDEINIDQIMAKVKAQNERGVRRECGLIILNLMLCLISNETDLNDLIYEMNKIFKSGDKKIISMIDDILGADYRIIDRVKRQFHLLMDNLVHKCLETERMNYSALTQIKLIQSLIWKLKGRDYPVLRNLNILEIFTQNMLRNLKISTEVLQVVNADAGNVEFGKEAISKYSIRNVFHELFEIYALQIFSKIKSFRSAIEGTGDDALPEGGFPGINLKRSHSNLEEDDYKKILEFVLNIFVHELSLPNADHANVKKYLLLLYKCMGYDNDLNHLIISISPKLFAILFSLLWKNFTADVKFVIIKIYYQFIKTFFVTDYYDEVIFTGIIQTLISLLKTHHEEAFTSLEISTQEDDFSPFEVLIKYFFFTLTSCINQNTNESTLIWELRDVFRLFFLLPQASEPLEKLILTQLTSMKNLKAVLFILGANVKSFHVGARVQVSSDLWKPNYELDLLQVDTAEDINAIYSNDTKDFKYGRILGFSSNVSLKNPFDDNHKDRQFKSPECCFNPNETGALSKYAYVILEESVIPATIKDSSFNVIRIETEKLILADEEINECDTAIYDFITKNKLLQLIFANCLLKSSNDVKYFALKLLYNVISSGENPRNVLSDEYLVASLAKFLLDESSRKSNRYEDIEYGICYTSWEYLEHELRMKLLYESNIMEQEDGYKEFYEYFSYSFTEANDFVIRQGYQEARFQILNIANNSENALLTKTQNRPPISKLSLYMEDEHLRVIRPDSLFFVEELDKYSNTEKVMKDLHEITTQQSIIAVISVYNSESKYQQMLSSLHIPIVFLSEYSFYEVVTYLFFGEANDFNFFSIDMIPKDMRSAQIFAQSVLSKENCSKKENEENADCIIYFPDIDEQVTTLKLNAEEVAKRRYEENIRRIVKYYTGYQKCLMLKLLSCASKRILMILIKSGILTDEITGQVFENQEDKIIEMFRLLTYEYYFDLNHLNLHVAAMKVKLLLFQVLFLLGSKIPKKISQTIFNYVLYLKAPNKDEIAGTQKQFIDNLKNFSQTEESILTKPELIEIKFQNILFVIQKKFEFVNLDSLFLFLSSILQLSYHANIRNSGLSHTMAMSLKIIYNKILNEQEGYLSLVNFFAAFPKIFNLDDLHKLLEYLKIDDLMQGDIKQIHERISKENTQLFNFFFNYLDLIFLLFFKYNVEIDITYWLTRSHPIINFYFKLQMFKKKFDFQSKDYLIFLSIMASKYELLGIFKDKINGNNQLLITDVYHRCAGSVPFFRKMSFKDHESTTIKVNPSLLGRNEILLMLMYTKENNQFVLQNIFKDDDVTNEQTLPDRDIFISSPFSNFKNSLWAFGSNELQALGCGGHLSRDYGEPQKCIGLGDCKIKTFKYGYHHPLVLTYDGLVYGAGKSEGSGLKNLSAEKTFTNATSINDIPSEEQGIKNIYVSNFNSTIILTNSNNLYGLGLNCCGNLSSSIEVDKVTNIPFKILPIQSSSKVKAVALGYKNTMVILEDGSAFTLGDNHFFQTGNMNTSADVTTWFQVPLPTKCTKFVSAAAGENYFIILMEEEDEKIRLYSMGCNDNGRCGVGDNTSGSLRKCNGVEELEFKFVSCRNFSSAAITRNGKLFTWGDNESGCLGLGKSAPNVVKSPQLVEYFCTNHIVDSVSIGAYHMVVLAREKQINGSYVKKVYSCGLNSKGALGFSDLNMDKQTVPREIYFFSKKNLMPVQIISSKYQTYVATIEYSFDASFICSQCNQSSNSGMEACVKHINKSTTPCFAVNPLTPFWCNECMKTNSSLNGWYRLTTNVKDDRIAMLEKLLPMEEVIKQGQYTEKVECCDCKNLIDYSNQCVNISTENPNIVLCDLCMDTQSTLIEYPQVFYSIYRSSRPLCGFPIQKISKDIFDVEASPAPLYSMKSSVITKFENDLYNFYKSDSVYRLQDLMTKITNQALLEFVELRDDVIHVLGDEKKLTYENMLEELRMYTEDSKYPMCKSSLLAETSQGSKAAFKIMNNFINMVNSDLFRLMKINDLSEDKSMLSTVIRENAHYLSSSERMKNFYDMLSKVTKNISAGSITVYLNRYQARKFYEKNEPDITATKTLFGQIYTQLKSCNKDRYLCKKDDRLFVVKLEGEGASDAGGPYRDVLYTACEELQSLSINLLIKSPNNKAELGRMRDRYIFNPSANMEIHYQMYQFLGRLMGYAICSGNLLNLNIHPIIWKQLLGQEVRFQEYESVDKIFVQFICNLEKVCQSIASKEEFENAFDLAFTIQNSNGVEKELVQDGKNVKLTLSNKDNFIELAKKERMNECENQIRYVKIGLNEVLNESFLNLLTWKELEDLVCGKPSIDLNELKKNTRYDSYSSSDTVIQWFWEVLSHFKNEEQVMYLKYVWGRSRLPRPEVFQYTHTICKTYTNSNPDQRLPQATTCFFTLKLPPYSKIEILEQKLRYVIFNCNEIDNDYQADPFNI